MALSDFIEIDAIKREKKERFAGKRMNL